jgi:hypothetical protein
LRARVECAIKGNERYFYVEQRTVRTL